MAVVNISGSVWSSLFYDHSCCDGDQEGFLVGEVVIRETTNISDSQINRKTEEVDINITCHCPCKEPFSFYDTKGNIDQVKILSLLKSNYKNVVGFYRFRRNTMPQPSLREMTLYHQLLASLPSGVKSDTFLLGIFSPYSSWNLATHSYPYQLFTYGAYDGFSARKVSLINLGDTAESEYKLSPVQASVASRSSGFQQILGNYSSQLVGQDESFSGVQTIRNLSNDVHNKLQELKQRVCDTESRLQQANQEVSELRRRAQRHRQERGSRGRPAPAEPLNTNNNAGIAKAMLPHAQKVDTHLPVAMETNQPATIQTSTGLQPAQGDSMQRGPPEKPDSRDRAATDPAGSESADPFAGLFKDMKQKMSKGRSSSFNAEGKGSSSGDKPAQNSTSGTSSRTVGLREAEVTGSNGTTSAASSQGSSQGQTKADSEVNNMDDDETQIEEDVHHYQATLSPTF